MVLLWYFGVSSDDSPGEGYYQEPSDLLQWVGRGSSSSCAQLNRETRPPTSVFLQSRFSSRVLWLVPPHPGPVVLPLSCTSWRACRVPALLRFCGPAEAPESRSCHGWASWAGCSRWSWRQEEGEAPPDETARWTEPPRLWPGATERPPLGEWRALMEIKSTVNKIKRLRWRVWLHIIWPGATSNLIPSDFRQWQWRI